MNSLTCALVLSLHLDKKGDTHVTYLSPLNELWRLYRGEIINGYLHPFLLIWILSMILDSIPRKLFFGPRRVMYIGPSFDFSRHAHHAVQLCIGINGPFDLILGDDEKPFNVRGALIPPDLSHQIKAKATDNAILMVYLDPESADYAFAITPEYTLERAVLWNEHENSIALEIDSYLSSGHETSPSTLIALVFKFFGLKADYLIPIDGRVKKVLHALNNSESGQCDSKTLETISCLSSSRMQHLFKQQIGIPIRRYSLWLRIRKVVMLIQQGHDFTSSALSCGFTDSAHFSRIFKEMFGVPPKTLFSNHAAIIILVMETL